TCDAGDELGQLTRAEAMLKAPRFAAPRADTPTLLRGLQLIYRVEGRTEEARRAIVDSWPNSDSPAEVIKQLALLDEAPLPMEMIHRVVDKGAENDDRVWLARANLAIRTGQFERAAEWLEACLRLQHGDGAVWSARLELSKSTGDPGGV